MFRKAHTVAKKICIFLNSAARFSEGDDESFRRRICFITEVDFDYGAAGGVFNDQKLLHCLKEFGDVELVYLQRRKYRFLWLALAIFIFDTMRAFSRPYQIYFSRGLVPSAVITCLKPFWKHKKIVNRNQAAFASSEVPYLGLGLIESFIRYFLFRFLEKNMLPRVDAITVPSVVYANELMEDGIGKNKIFVIPYYVEDEFFKQPLNTRLGSENEFFTFSYVGGFHAYHDLSPLIEAFELLVKNNNNVKLVLVGDGSQRPKIEEMVRGKRLEEKILFKGKLPHSLVPSFLTGVDAFVYLARTAGISTSLLEAAAAGKPIITLRKKGDQTLTRYFSHGKEIYIVNRLSPDEIAKALNSVLADPDLRANLSEGARKVALAHFNKESTMRELNKLVSAMRTDNTERR